MQMDMISHTVEEMTTQRNIDQEMMTLIATIHLLLNLKANLDFILL